MCELQFVVASVRSMADQDIAIEGQELQGLAAVLEQILLDMKTVQRKEQTLKGVYRWQK